MSFGKPQADVLGMAFPCYVTLALYSLGSWLVDPVCLTGRLLLSIIEWMPPNFTNVLHLWVFLQSCKPSQRLDSERCHAQHSAWNTAQPLVSSQGWLAKARPSRSSSPRSSPSESTFRHSAQSSEKGHGDTYANLGFSEEKPIGLGAIQHLITYILQMIAECWSKQGSVRFARLLSAQSEERCNC